MKNKKTSRIEIRLPEDIKNKFFIFAQQNNTTMSKIIYNFILS